ncbi:NAD(P)-dependent oxidoreductase [Endozoicomonas sp. (ex Bugula neritina AB1)]|nr:NAD(P)-dependent oxidoreductase [Endozoicomonas sp. (ex Bugula neritina AB1)]
MVKKILVLGANGMLGGSLFRYFSSKPEYEVLGTVRSPEAARLLADQGFGNTVANIDVISQKVLSDVFSFQPDIVFNCIGLIKQLKESKSPVSAIDVNALLPHRLAELCDFHNAKLIHFSTDCVFSGEVGNYLESDVPDSLDIYGRSKLLGEVDYGNHLTLRTSIIGHEIDSNLSLVDWFLSQSERVKGYSNAVFSGLPTVYMAEVIEKYIFPNEQLKGLLHLSVSPIDKYKLLSIIKDVYSKEIDIDEYPDFTIDRSLNSSHFQLLTGFTSLSWEELIVKMHEEYVRYFK